MVEKSKSVVVKTPKGLTKLEWESIYGSNLHSQMIKNRSIMLIDNEPASKKMLKIVQEWLETNCGSQYYFEERRDTAFNYITKYNIAVYLEGDTDAVSYCLFFKDHEYPEEDPPQVKLPPPFSLRKTFRPITAPSMEKELMDLIMQELIVQDQKTRYVNVKDRWSDTVKSLDTTAFDDTYKTSFNDLYSDIIDYQGDFPPKKLPPKSDDGK